MKSAVLLTSLLAVAMAACAATREQTSATGTSAQAPATVSREQLTNEGAWALVSVNGGPASTAQALMASGLIIKLQFVDRVTVLGGCNLLSGDYRLEGHQLIVGELSSTRMACPDARQRADKTMMALLAHPLKISQHKAQLKLQAASGEVLLFDAIPLTQ